MSKRPQLNSLLRVLALAGAAAFAVQAQAAEKSASTPPASPS